jgi:hypothetical protein
MRDALTTWESHVMTLVGRPGIHAPDYPIMPAAGPRTEASFR